MSREFTADQREKIVVQYKKVIDAYRAIEKVQERLNAEMAQLANMAGEQFRNIGEVEEKMRFIFGDWVIRGEFTQKEF